ncbi:MAG: nitronate monooxygenase family protein [Dehalococcoidia bacterium]
MPASPLHTPLCELLGIEHPIILAGMGGVATAELVSAVSEAGGLGVVGAASMGADEIRSQVRRIRDLTNQPFGVDILLPANVSGPAPSFEGDDAKRSAGATLPQALPQQYSDWVGEALAEFNLSEPPSIEGNRGIFTSDFTKRQAEAIIEEQVPIFASGLGNPAAFVKDVHAYGGKVISLVGNVKAARKVNEGGVDVVVAQGHEAGGHTGRIGTMALVPQVVDAVAPTYVAAAGGIGDGRGIIAALALGAVGAWVGTAFLVSEEANWPRTLKQRILDASEEDTRVTRLYSGKTMRNINNPLIENWEKSGLQALPMGFQGMISGRVQRAAFAGGRVDLTMNPAGQISGMFSEIRPAAEIFADIVESAVRVLETLRREGIHA